MAEIAFREEASEDLGEVFARGAEQFGLEAADRYHSGLEQAVLRFASFPLLGPVYPGIRPPIRYLSHRSHQIFYDFDGSTVWIVRILHHARDAQLLI